MDGVNLKTCFDGKRKFFKRRRRCEEVENSVMSVDELSISGDEIKTLKPTKMATAPAAKKSNFYTLKPANGQPNFTTTITCVKPKNKIQPNPVKNSLKFGVTSTPRPGRVDLKKFIDEPLSPIIQEKNIVQGNRHSVRPSKEAANHLRKPLSSVFENMKEESPPMIRTVNRVTFEAHVVQMSNTEQIRLKESNSVLELQTHEQFVTIQKKEVCTPLRVQSPEREFPKATKSVPHMRESSTQLGARKVIKSTHLSLPASSTNKLNVLDNKSTCHKSNCIGNTPRSILKNSCLTRNNLDKQDESDDDDIFGVSKSIKHKLTTFNLSNSDSEGKNNNQQYQKNICKNISELKSKDNINANNSKHKEEHIDNNFDIFKATNDKAQNDSQYLQISKNINHKDAKIDCFKSTDIGIQEKKTRNNKQSVCNIRNNDIEKPGTSKYNENALQEKQISKEDINKKKKEIKNTANIKSIVKNEANKITRGLKQSVKTNKNTNPKRSQEVENKNQDANKSDEDVLEPEEVINNNKKSCLKQADMNNAEPITKGQKSSVRTKKKIVPVINTHESENKDMPKIKQVFNNNKKSCLKEADMNNAEPITKGQKSSVRTKKKIVPVVNTHESENEDMSEIEQVFNNNNKSLRAEQIDHIKETIESVIATYSSMEDEGKNLLQANNQEHLTGNNLEPELVSNKHTKNESSALIREKKRKAPIIELDEEEGEFAGSSQNKTRRRSINNLASPLEDESLVIMPPNYHVDRMPCFPAMNRSLKTVEPGVSKSLGIVVNKLACGGNIFLHPDKVYADKSSNNIMYYVIKGTALVKIHNTTKALKENSFFFVPFNVPYEIKNDGARKLILSFMKTSTK